MLVGSEFQRPRHQGAVVAGLTPGTTVLECRVLLVSTLCQGPSGGRGKLAAVPERAADRSRLRCGTRLFWLIWQYWAVEGGGAATLFRCSGIQDTESSGIITIPKG